MSESETLVTALLSGAASGAMLVIALVVLRSTLSAHVRFATLAFALSATAWLICESPALRALVGPAHWVLEPLVYPVGALFWLFVLTVFDDVPVTPLALAPAAVLFVTGPLYQISAPPAADWLWYGRNGFGALLAVHASLVVLRGWRGDLVEGRRRFRALLLGLACVFVVVLVAAGFAHRADPHGPWLMVTAGRAGGAAIMTVLALSMAVLSLQVRPTTFGAARRLELVGDARAEAADRLLIDQLNTVMAGEAWRREGLTIGNLAGDLATPEHRLRRLINQRLGHRNFADFVNGYRIEAAKRRLADPAQARTTVAVIAFDLGFGSLGPFNRAFKTVTGATPTEWRREAMQASPELKEAV